MSHTVLRELDCLNMAGDHPSIVQLQKSYFWQTGKGEFVVFVFSYMEEGDLDRYIRTRYKQGMQINMVIDFT
jgi:serine/threonine protein kinase